MERRGWEQAKGDEEVRQAWQPREYVTPGLVLDVNKRMIHQNVTGQKDGYYPGNGKMKRKKRKRLFLAVE